MKKVLIYGASSSIARFTAIEFAKNGANLILAGRNFEKLNAVRHDILARYKTDIEILTSDALDFENHKAFVDKSINMFGSIDVVLLAHGTLPDQALIQDSPAQIIEEFNSNAMSVISLATLYASYFEN